MYEICEDEWIKSHLLITQWLIFAGLHFADVFFLLELIFADQVPSTIPSNFKYRIIKVLQGMFVQSLFWNSSFLQSQLDNSFCNGHFQIWFSFGTNWICMFMFMVNLEIIRNHRCNVSFWNNLELMIYLKRDAELWTMYNKSEVWSISDTPALQRFFLVFFLLVVLSFAKDRKYSVFKRVKLFFPDRHFLVKYGICFHRAISPGIWAAKLNCIFTKARKFKKMAADEVLLMTSFMLILAIFLRRRPSFFQRMRSLFLQLRRTRWYVVIRLIIKRCLSQVCVRFFSTHC